MGGALVGGRCRRGRLGPGAVGWQVDAAAREAPRLRGVPRADVRARPPAGPGGARRRDAPRARWDRYGAAPTASSRRGTCSRWSSEPRCPARLHRSRGERARHRRRRRVAQHPAARALARRRLGKESRWLTSSGRTAQSPARQRPRRSSESVGACVCLALRFASPAIGESLTPRLTRAQGNEHMPRARCSGRRRAQPPGYRPRWRACQAVPVPQIRTEGKTRSRAADGRRRANWCSRAGRSRRCRPRVRVRPPRRAVSGSTHRPAARARRSAAAACFFCCFSSRRSRTACSRVRFAAVCCRLDFELTRTPSVAVTATMLSNG